MWRVLSGVLLGWSLGANDTANVFGTGVATGAVKYGRAVVLTAIFVFMGALLEGPKCMKTLTELSSLSPNEAFYCSLAAGLTMTVLTVLALPASTSQAIVGAVVGVGVVSGSADISRLYTIVSCWVLTPLCAMLLGLILHKILGFVLDRTVADITRRNLLYSTGILVAGCYGAYTLGSNNVANVTGVYVGAGLLNKEMAVLIGGLSIASGTLTYSKKVMMTIGKGIAPLDPFSALVAVLAGALSLHIFTQIGVPVSSSQAIVGAVAGVGIVRDIRTVSPAMLVKILLGWILTPLAAGLLTFVILTGAS